MATGSVCGKCGAELTGVGAEQLCPGCLLEGGLASRGERGTTAEQSLIANRESQIKTPFPRPFGDYELLEEIARGGMGIVYRARQVSLDRIVAVKMLLFGPMASPQLVQRFRTEAAAAASLQHPNIVAIHEVGFREGQHFFAMDYVNGLTLAQLVANGLLPARGAASYVKTIAEAIHFAHERGVLHRDLKPSNVLIDAATGQPRVTDFGLAKRLDKDTDLTLSGHVLGSPNYMPPEQAAAHRGLVGKRSDVYSLGAVLYHLLTGRAPFVAETVTDTLQLVQNADPVSPRALNPSVPRDLETICLKCLEKEPGKRYQSAQALADELGRWLGDEPIQARPVSRVEHAWRWCRRKPVNATLSATTVLLLLAVAIGSPIAAYRIKRERNIAQGRLYAAQMKLAHAAWRDGKVGGALKLLRAQPSEFRGFDWRYDGFLKLWDVAKQRVLLSTNGPKGLFAHVSFSPRGNILASGAPDGASVNLWEFEAPTTSTPALTLKTNLNFNMPLEVAFAPDNQTVALCNVGAMWNGVGLYDLPSGRRISLPDVHTDLIFSAAFSPDGSLLATGGVDEQVVLWDTQRQAPICTNITELVHVTSLAFAGLPFHRTVRRWLLDQGVELWLSWMQAR